MRALIVIGVCALPIFAAMGLLPILHPQGSNELEVLNWGFLGTSGSLAAILLDFRNSNLIEVGAAEGKKEMWRGITGTVLGFLGGVLVFSLLSGGLVEGPAIPSFETVESGSKNLGLSILWAIASGYSFEWVFTKMKASTTGSQ